MAEPFLKYRTRFTSSLKNELVPLFDQLAKKTRIPKSRLLDEAIEDLLTKYNKVQYRITDRGHKRLICLLCPLFLISWSKGILCFYQSKPNQ